VAFRCEVPLLSIQISRYQEGEGGGEWVVYLNLSHPNDFKLFNLCPIPIRPWEVGLSDFFSMLRIIDRVR
jgi:hypothetical protein